MKNEQQTTRLSGLDGLRGISILLVIMCHSLWYKHVHLPDHAAQVLNRLTSPLGLFGVPIFFVISGFLITYLLLREEDSTGTISLKQFWIRRFLRIVPPVLLYFLFVLGYSYAVGLHLHGLDLAAVILFFRNLVNGDPVTDHFWSLSIEEQFYLGWPLAMVLISRRWRLPVALLLLAAFPVIRIFSVCVFPHHLHVLVTRIVRFDSILAGCSLAIAWKMLGYRTLPIRLGDRLCAGGLAATLAAWIISALADVHPNYYGTATVGKEILQELVTVLLNLGVVSVMIALATESTRLGRIINMKWLTGIGVISYSLYLWQQFFFFAPSLPHWMYYLPIRLLGAFTVAAGSYYLVEGPMNRIRKRIKRSPLAPPGAEAETSAGEMSPGPATAGSEAE